MCSSMALSKSCCARPRSSLDLPRLRTIPMESDRRGATTSPGVMQRLPTELQSNGIPLHSEPHQPSSIGLTPRLEIAGARNAWSRPARLRDPAVACDRLHFSASRTQDALARCPQKFLSSFPRSGYPAGRFVLRRSFFKLGGLCGLRLAGGLTFAPQPFAYDFGHQHAFSRALHFESSMQFGWDQDGEFAHLRGSLHGGQDPQR